MFIGQHCWNLMGCLDVCGEAPPSDVSIPPGSGLGPWAGVPGVQPGVHRLEGAVMVGAGLVPGPTISQHPASSVTNPGPVSKLHDHTVRTVTRGATPS